ncbi:MAG TPA: DUF433 domain-containing protein [Solirubrobacteraceae bacterium]|nr:DUF433 domain-containing protein [Solirubrobacteraceae bacterium]
MTSTAADIETTRGDLGHGIYSLAELRMLITLYGEPKDGKQTAHWLRHALNPVEHKPWHADHSFSDLISLFVVTQLAKRGVAARTIRDAEMHLRTKWKTDRPFAREDIKTDGVEVFCEDEPEDGRIEAASRFGQLAMREAVQEGLASVFYNEGNAAYWVPMKGVLIDPRVQFGEPVVKGTRIPTSAVAGVVHNLGREEAVLRFSLTADLLESALAFEDRIAALN